MSAESSSIPEQAIELFAEPLDRFTSARNELASELKEKGQNAEAGKVRALKKPNLAAWAINQLARSRKQDVAELLEVTEQMTVASTPQEVREAIEERNRRVRALVDAAETILEEGGHSAGASTLQQIMRTFYAAHPEGERDRLLHGTLERPLDSSGFGDVPGLSLETPQAEETSRGDDSERRRLEEELAEAKARAAQLDREAAKARLEADAADGAAAEARRLVTRIQDKLNGI
jgi:hypothetical protein